MARKKALGEIKALTSNSEKYIFGYSEDWEAGEIVDTDEDEEYWDYLVPGGTLEECLEAIAINLSMEVHKEAGKFVHDGEDFSFEAHFERMGRMREEELANIKRECLSKGKYMGKGWQIRSQRTKEECQWLKRNGYPYFG